MLGVREPQIYGNRTYEDLCRMIQEYADNRGVTVTIRQSNHEGDLVDWIQQSIDADGLILNPAAYTHTSVAILDALKSVGVPAVEVHISDVTKREDFRQISYIRSYCHATVCGHGLEGYLEAMDHLIDLCGDTV